MHCLGLEGEVGIISNILFCLNYHLYKSCNGSPKQETSAPFHIDRAKSISRSHATMHGLCVTNPTSSKIHLAERRECCQATKNLLLASLTARTPTALLSQSFEPGERVETAHPLPTRWVGNEETWAPFNEDTRGWHIGDYRRRFLLYLVCMHTHKKVKQKTGCSKLLHAWFLIQNEWNHSKAHF